MPRPAPLAAAADPISITGDGATGDAAVEWYTLADAKTYLNIPLDDTADDARLLLGIAEGLGWLSLSTGRDFSTTTYTAEYGCQSYQTRVLRVPAINVLVNQVFRVDSNGVDVEVLGADFQVLTESGQRYIRLNPDVDPFEGDPSGGVVAKVVYATTFDKNGAETQVARGIMNEFMSWHFYGRAHGDPRAGSHVQRSLRMLRDFGGVGRVLTN